MTSKHKCIGLSNKDGCIFFIKLVSHTFPDKESHKQIIYEYILKLGITESNNMEGFQRELQRRIKQYDAIQGSEWKKFTNHIIKQYQQIDSPPFNMGFNMLIVMGPANTQTKYGWICTLLEWTNTTCHDLITRNIWPKPEITTSQELNTMPMYDKKWVTHGNSWKSNTSTEKTKPWPDSSTKQTTQRSISTTATADRSNISYGPYLSTHVFTKVNIDAPNPTDNISPFGAQNAIVGLATMTNSIMNAFDGKIRKMHKWQNKMITVNKHNIFTMVLCISRT
jgi:hypothetical protein